MAAVAATAAQAALDAVAAEAARVAGLDAEEMVVERAENKARDLAAAAANGGECNIDIDICICMYIYIYIYIERERERRWWRSEQRTRRAISPRPPRTGVSLIYLYLYI